MAKKKTPVRKALFLGCLLIEVILLSSRAWGAELRSVSEPMFAGSDCNATFAEADTASANGKVPVILIHGWDFHRPGVPNPEVWDNFLAYSHGMIWPTRFVKFYTFSYCSNLVPTAKIAQLLNRLVLQMRELDADFAGQPIIVGHSYGGLIGRSYMQEVRLENGQFAGDSVARLITLGTPHCGTPMANGPARDDKLGPYIVWADGVFDLYYGHVQWFEDNRFDLRSDGCDHLLDYARFPFDTNLWLQELNSRNPYRSKIAAYGGSIAPADSLDNCFLKFDLSCSAFAMDAFLNAPDSDGVVLPVSSTLMNCSDCAESRILWGYDHFEMASGKSAADGNLFNLILGNISDFVWTKDIFYFSPYALIGDVTSESYHNLRGWGPANPVRYDFWRYQNIGGTASADVYVRQTGIPYTLAITAADGVCDDSWDAYIRQGNAVTFLYSHKHETNRGFVTYSIPIKAGIVTKNRVTVEIVNRATDACGRGAINVIELR